MATRRDLFQSYQFMVQRVISGVVLRETDPVQSPLRRMSGAMFGGIMLAVLALAATGVIGVIFPSGNTSWQEPGRVIIEDETGARFVWLPDQTGQNFLYPVTNFASAVLLAGSTETVGVSRNSLLEAPRGPRLGLPDAPDSLPDPERMLGGPWTLCSLPAQTVSGEQVPNTALVVGRGRTEGVPTDESAVLVRDTQQGGLHMIWGGYQFPIPAEDQVLEGLTLRLEPQIEVGTAWLSALPAGEGLAPPFVRDRGIPSQALPGATVGQLRYVESGGNRQNYLVAVDRIIEITQVQAQILLADPVTSDSAYGGQPPVATALSAVEANTVPRRALPAPEPNDAPALAPTMADVGSEQSTVCASFADGAGARPEIALQASVAGTTQAAATQRRTEEGTVLADRVLVEPGWGSIVESVTSPTAVAGSLHLITDEGRRYPLPSADQAALLGYGGVEPVQMPASLVARIPAGDILDPAAAARAS